MARRRKGAPPWVVPVAVAVVGWLVLLTTHRLLAWVVFGLVLLGLVAVPAWRELDRQVRRRTLRRTNPVRAAAVRPPPRRPAVRVETPQAAPTKAPPGGMTGPEFERLVAGLLERDGCEDVRISGGAGDRGADLTAITPHGHRLVVQCKGYRSHPVGDPDMQRFLGTVRQVHNAEIPLFVTTSRFTRSATQLARDHGIVLVDGTTLAAWQGAAWALPTEPTDFVGDVR